MKLLRASRERAFSSVSFADLNMDMKRLSKQTRAAPLIPVSGRTVSMCISQVADRKHDEYNAGFPLLRPSAKASNKIPNSWLTMTNAILLSHASAACSSSYQ